MVTGPRVPLTIGIVVPLGLLALAYGVWWISDQLVVIGPLDRAKVGWLVVIPLLAATPAVAAMTWRDLTPRHSGFAALFIGLVVGLLAAALFTLALWGDSQGCQFGTRLTPFDFVSGALITGVVTGGGYAGGGLVATALLRASRKWAAVIVGAAVGFLVPFTAAIAASSTFGFVGICNRGF